MKCPLTPTTLRASILLLLTVLFVASVNHTKKYKRTPAPESLNIVLSPIVQMFMAGGDRFLATNIAVLRASIFPLPSINPESAAALGQVHWVASQLNPANEDNYYTAQGILPWYGQIETTRKVLSAAADNRPFDFLPLFFLGFNAMHFEKKFTESGDYFQRAAMRMHGDDKLKLQAMAAKFYEKGDDPDFAIRVIKAMQDGTRSKALKDHLQIRIARLEMLKFLRSASKRYEERYHQPPAKLDDLVSSGTITSLPIDPFGVGFELSPQGVPVFIMKKAAK